MAVYYVWSGAVGSGTGANWANAYTKLANAASISAANDVFYVAHDHSETTAANVLLLFAGLNTTANKVICVNRAGSVPPVSADRRATAQIASSGNFQIISGGTIHYDGIIFVCGNSTGVANITAQNNTNGWVRFENCSLRFGSTGASRLTVNGDGNFIELINTTLSFSGLLQGVTLLGPVFKWRNTPSALIGTAVPTALFNATVNAYGECECIGVDLSAAGSGKTIVSSASVAAYQRFRFVDCKLDAAVSKSTVPQNGPGSNEIDFLRCGASGNYTLHRHRFSGLLTEETTIVRTGGGATDGVTPISWKIISTALCTNAMPFECPPIAIWNDATGSAKTATVECIGAAVATDQEVWLEAEYLSDASSPQGSFANDGKTDLLATAVNQTTSTAVWGGSTAPFKLAVTFTPQQKGWLYARVKIGKASATYYVDPLITLT